MSLKAKGKRDTWQDLKTDLIGLLNLKYTGKSENPFTIYYSRENIKVAIAWVDEEIYLHFRGLNEEETQLAKEILELHDLIVG